MGGDDIWFRNILGNFSLPEFLSMRYHTWTSRLTIETFLVILTHLPFIFSLINAAVITLLIYAITYIFTPRRIKDILIVTLTCGTLDFALFASAGWGATLLNYLWPLAFGLAAFIPLKDLYDKKKPSFKKCIFLLFGLIFAVNQEQFACISLGVLVLFSVFSLYREKKLHPYLVASLALTVASLIFILVCPGNAARSAAETAMWYPEFANFSPFYKGFLGITTITIGELFHPAPIFIITLIVLTVIIFKKYKHKLIRAVPLVLFALIIFFSQLEHIINYSGIPKLRYLYTLQETFLTPNPEQPFLSTKVLLGVGLSAVFIVCLVLTVYFAMSQQKVNRTKDKNWPMEQLLFPIIICAGLASRAIMGFSPTIYASSGRTTIFFYISLVIVTVVAINRLEKMSKKQQVMSLFYAGCALPILFSISHTVQVSGLPW